MEGTVMNRKVSSLRFGLVLSGLLAIIGTPGLSVGSDRATGVTETDCVAWVGPSATVLLVEPGTKRGATRLGKRVKKQSVATKEGKKETASEEQKSGSRPQFIRLATRKDEPQFLQTAIVSYVPRPLSKAESPPAETDDQARPSWPDDLRVDLVGVIHIADRSYYEQLNRILKKYDVVLYELVAPEGTRVTPGQQSAHPVSVLQQSLTNMLGLSYQLDVIDYHRSNFVHADLSPEQFYQAMQERGESTWAMFLRAFGYEWARSMARQKSTNDVDLLRALFSKDRQLELKRLFAQEMADDVEGQIRALEGPQGSTLIAGRNERVLEVLKDQVKTGVKTIAIFYGAGHMPHFHDRLTQLGFMVDRTRWLNAWDLRATPDSPVSESSTNQERP